jgi:hypothetical protein
LTLRYAKIAAKIVAAVPKMLRKNERSARISLGDIGDAEK